MFGLKTLSRSFSETYLVALEMVLPKPTRFVVLFQIELLTGLRILG